MSRSLSAPCVVALTLLLGAPAAASEIVYLSGTGNEDPVEWEFSCSEGRNCGSWTTIAVPSNWELQGFGRYDYGRDDSKRPENGSYRYRFEVPRAWAGQRVDLVFEGVMTDTTVRLNGRSAGPVHQGGFYRFRFDVSELLDYSGPNLLEVDVSEASSNDSVNRAERDADYWVFGGIYRPVYLQAFPAESIRHLAIDARADGQLSVDLQLRGVTAARRLVATVRDARGELAGDPVVGVVDAGQQRARLETRIDEVRPWTAETPHLYHLAVCLIPLSPQGSAGQSDCAAEAAGGGRLHRVEERFGFRTVEIHPGDGIYVNGSKVVLKGINRHAFWPSSGRTTSHAISRRDVELIKEMNLNAVRASHYPPDTHFLDACDEIGLYVLDELAGWKDAYDSSVGRPLVESMVTRDVNHPSVIFWNNGNEGGWNPELDAVFGEHDPQDRPVLHPDSDEPFQGLQTRHYRDWKTVRGYLASEPKGGGEAPPIVLPTEFLHGLFDGGHGAGLDDYWSLIRSSPRGAGGFLWALLDEGVVRTDRDGEIDVAGNYAPDGIVGPYREKEGSFFTARHIFSPVVLGDLYGRVASPAFDGRLEVRNDHDFLDLTEIHFLWRLIDLPGPWGAPQSRVVTEGVSRTGSVPPREAGVLQLELPPAWRDHDVLQLEAVGPGGRAIRRWDVPLRSTRSVRRALVASGDGRPAVRHKASKGAIRLSTDRVSVTFDTASGEIAAVSVDGRPFSLRGGPRLGRAPPRAVAIEARPSGGAWEIGARYAGPLESVWWRLEPSGWLRLRYRYRLEGEIETHGIGFDYPEELVQAVRWRGLGPYRLWKNRRQGASHAVWETPRNDTVTGTSWRYPEFQGFYGGVYWTRWLTTEGSLAVVFDQDDRFLHNFSPRVPEAPLNTRVAFPPSRIGFPHAIPAIGTKFHQPAALGPSGQPGVALGVYTESLYFYFGEPDALPAAAH